MSNVSQLIKMRAYCDRNGIIYFNRVIPEGMLPILTVCYADEDVKEFQERIIKLADIRHVTRLGKDGKKELHTAIVVGGVFDAPFDDLAALQALRAFNNLFRK